MTDEKSFHSSVNQVQNIHALIISFITGLLENKKPTNFFV